MFFLTLLIIALGLAMDAFAVSVVSGAAYKKLKIRHVFRIAFFFGAFQAIMPVIGYGAAVSVSDYIEKFDHWIVFFLLCGVGAKMIYESFKMKESEQVMDPSKILVLLILSVATSIDALAVGVSLSLMTDSVFMAAAVIGVVTFFVSYLGVIIGKRFGHFFENRIEAIGGLILIGIGIKILAGHIFYK
ncbi:MAG: manganese efflux pump [Phycisphaerae bacterium]|nr:manganese efflux pump [Phycisphaerae bacterium]